MNYDKVKAGEWEKACKKVKVLTAQLTSAKAENTEWQEQIAGHCIEIAELKEQLSALQADTRWIPVGEGLPEKSMNVLVLSKNGHIYVACFNPSGNTFKSLYRNTKYYKTTHWRPIDLPKGA